MPVVMLGRFLERGFTGLPSLGLRALLCSRVCPASSHTGEWGLRSVCGRTAGLIGPTDFTVLQMAAGEKLGVFQSRAEPPADAQEHIHLSRDTCPPGL